MFDLWFGWFGLRVRSGLFCLCLISVDLLVLCLISYLFDSVLLICSIHYLIPYPYPSLPQANLSILRRGGSERVCEGAG